MNRIGDEAPDLAGYGLAHLAEKPRSAWNEAEIDRLLEVFSKEDIYPAFNIEFTPPNIDELLKLGSCRRCGRCCLPNPAKPGDRGIMVHEDELKQIAQATGISYKELLKNTSRDKNPGRKHFRLIGYPCLFYSDKGCRAYENRPTICSVYPVTNFVRSDGTHDIKINVKCDYGRDIYKALHRIMARQE